MALVLQDVCVRFRSESGTVTAIQDISADIPEGNFASVIGPSGCGKSTLLRVVADLVAPTTGFVTVLGGNPAAARTRRLISFVFQDATLLPWRTALENVCLPLEVGPKRTQRQLKRSPTELLGLVGLAGRENALPNELSGGMRQRVAIARALVCEPRVLLMDEPFGGLDEITRDSLNDELLKIWRETGITILFVTHSVPEATYLGQTVFVMATNPGRLREVVTVPLDAATPRDRDSGDFIRTTAHLRSILATC